jgi:competence protein ComGC
MPTRLHALTLIELVIVCAIIAVLVGIVWVMMAPIREKARQTRCMTNLRQVWMALENYRHDHDGVDPNGTPLEYWELGLPDGVDVLVATGYIPVEVARCPDDLALHLGHDPEFPEVRIHPTLYVSFSPGWWDKRDPVIAKRKGIKFPDMVRKLLQFWIGIIIGGIQKTLLMNAALLCGSL